jgi:hypothetical protein
MIAAQEGCNWDEGTAFDYSDSPDAESPSLRALNHHPKDSLRLLVIPLDHETSAHYSRAMKNITLSADARTIELAREEARKRKTTLNALFREWIEDLAARETRRSSIKGLFEQMKDFDSGGPFTRDQMNER